MDRAWVMKAPLRCSPSLSAATPVFYQMLNTAAEGSSIPEPIHHTLPHTHSHTLRRSTATLHFSFQRSCWRFNTCRMNNAAGKVFLNVEGEMRWHVTGTDVRYVERLTALLPSDVAAGGKKKNQNTPNSFHVQCNNYFHPVILIRIWLQRVLPFALFFSDDLLQKKRIPVCGGGCDVCIADQTVVQQGSDSTDVLESVWSRHFLTQNPRDTPRSGLCRGFTHVSLMWYK